MGHSFQAVYEDGILRPLTQLLLKEGQKVVVTVRPLADLTPAEYDSRRAELLRRMEAAGMIEHVAAPDQPPPADWRPLQIDGEPLSETIIKMRRGE